MEIKYSPSMYDSYDRNCKLVLYKEDVMNRIHKRMSVVIQNADEKDRKKLQSLNSFLLSTIADM